MTRSKTVAAIVLAVAAVGCAAPVTPPAAAPPVTKEIQIVNGLTPGAITAALAGEAVGTVVHAD